MAAWEKAGAKTGWMGPGEFGEFTFRASGQANDWDLPAFQFKWRETVLSQLPLPAQPFGLDLHLGRITDAG